MHFPMKCVYCFAARNMAGSEPAVAMFNGETICYFHFEEIAMPVLRGHAQTKDLTPKLEAHKNPKTGLFTRLTRTGKEYC